MPQSSAEDRFGRRLRIERERRGWSQVEMARRMAAEGVSLHFSAINKIENRDATRPRIVRLNEAEAAAAALGIPLGALLIGEGALEAQVAELRAEALRLSDESDEALRRAVQFRNEAARLAGEAGQADA